MNEVKLHQIPKGSKIKIDEGFITFHHIDGMYSYCTCDWVKENNVIHLSAVTPLKKVGDYYEIIE
jgi:hypothetical protein